VGVCRCLCVVFTTKHECSMEAAVTLTVYSVLFGGLHDLTVCGSCATAWRSEKGHRVMADRVNLAADCDPVGRRL
jgi:hypothetical protein